MTTPTDPPQTSLELQIALLQQQLLQQQQAQQPRPVAVQQQPQPIYQERRSVPPITFTEIDARVDLRVKIVELTVNELRSLLYSMLPDGPDHFSKHRQTHERLDTEFNERREFKRDVTKEITKYIVHAVLFAFATVSLLGIQAKVSEWNSKSVDTPRATLGVPASQVQQPPQQPQPSAAPVVQQQQHPPTTVLTTRTGP